MMKIESLLQLSQQKGASDLHISTGMPPIFRINGAMTTVSNDIIDHQTATELIYSIMTEDQIKKFEKEWEIDFSFSLDATARFRANVFKHSKGNAAVLRMIPHELKSMEALNMGTVFQQLANKPRGLILITGPTGSGKSTTLATMVDYINTTSAQHIITIEDPIEFIHQSKKSLISQREVNKNTHSFANAMRSALREDPDIILVGEMRDLETVRLALTAAETGHLVMATLHTTSAPKTIDRIIDLFPEYEKSIVRSMLAESLQGVISQTLIPNTDQTGRVAIHEIMLGTTAIRNLIRENKVAQMYSVIQTNQALGMQTLDQGIEKAMIKGKINPEHAKKYAVHQEKFK